MVMYMGTNKEMLDKNCEAFVTLVGIFVTIKHLIFKLDPVIFKLDPVNVLLGDFPKSTLVIFCVVLLLLGPRTLSLGFIIIRCFG